MKKWEIQKIRAEDFIERADRIPGGVSSFGDPDWVMKSFESRIALAQVAITVGDVCGARMKLCRALMDFSDALCLSYQSTSEELSHGFYLSLILPDLSIAQFVASVPFSNWPLGSEIARWQAFFGFSVLRGEAARTQRVLDYLMGLCFDGGGGSFSAPHREFQCATWRAFDALHRRDARSFAIHIQRRVALWPQTLTDEQRDDCRNLYDLMSLGFIRLAWMAGMTLDISALDLPLVVLEDPRGRVQ